MGNRLSKIYTRTGDQGTTGLGDGTRIDKDSLRVEAMGTVDELNAVIGLLLTEPLSEPIRMALTRVQHDLFDLGGELCIPGHAMLKPGRIAQMEQTLDELNDPLPPLKEFILPGGSRAAAYCHLARTVCRRAERAVVGVAATALVRSEIVIYLNRLSDLLFVMARHENQVAGVPDVAWAPRAAPAPGA